MIFFDIKGVVQALLDTMGVRGVRLEAVERPYLLPGQAARIMADEPCLGVLGSLNALVKEKYRIRNWAGCFELDLQLLTDHKVGKSYQGIAQYPSVLRDLAVTAPRQIPSEEMEGTIRSVGKDLIEVYLFDLYEGKGIPEGQRSLAWSLTFQSPERTLTDEEVDGTMEAIVGALEKEHGAKLR